MGIKVFAVIVAAALVFPAYAAAKQGPKNLEAKASAPAAAKPTATEKVATEATGAIVDVLAGNEETKTVTTTTTTAGREGSMPPGLAKKDKVPPGWSHGNKTGWDKDRTQTVTVEKEDSPLKALLKKILGGGSSSKSAR